jgi:hypothetical protein
MVSIYKFSDEHLSPTESRNRLNTPNLIGTCNTCQLGLPLPLIPSRQQLRAWHPQPMAALFTIYGIELAVWNTTYPTGTRHAGYDIRTPVHSQFHKIFPVLYSTELLIIVTIPQKYTENLTCNAKKIRGQKLEIQFQQLTRNPFYIWKNLLCRSKRSEHSWSRESKFSTEPPATKRKQPVKLPV